MYVVDLFDSVRRVFTVWARPTEGNINTSRNKAIN